MSVKNRTIFTGDCLHIMRGMADGCIDLIYLDPPFKSDADYAAPIGSEAAGAEFKDTWGLSDIDLAWYGEIADKHPGLYELLTSTRTVNGDSMMSYLIYMAVRVIEMKRLLRDTGSIYLHCDWHSSHYLKLMMYAVFGKDNFRNEVIWHYYNKYSAGKRIFARNYDSIFFYSKTNDYLFNPQRQKRKKPVKQLMRENVGGVLKNKRDKDGKLMYRESKDKKVDAVWAIPCLQPRSVEWTGYKTQKNSKLLRRIILASSNHDDIVLDPFCGCATACVAAEIEGRQWIGIDVGPKAYDLVKSRLAREVKVGEGEMFGDVIHRTDIPTDRKGKRSKDIKHTLYGRQEGACNGCLTWFPFRNMTLDHKTPRAKGGADTDDNLQLLCGACNSKKGDRTMEELIAALTAEGIRQ